MITDDCLRSIINAADTEDDDDVAVRYMLVAALLDTDTDLPELMVLGGACRGDRG
jgi:2-phosphoglycerate kinase